MDPQQSNQIKENTSNVKKSETIIYMMTPAER